MMERPIERFASGFLGAAALALAVPLGLYAYNGTLMRYSGDDYCYGGIFIRQGFWPANLYSYLHVSTYNGNRYALSFFSFVADALGPWANAAYPWGVILLWVLAAFLTLRAVGRAGSFGFRPLELFLAAEALVVFTLTQTPDVTQSLYWRSGMLPYTAPLVANLFLLAGLLHAIRAERWGWVSAVGIGLLALVVGGFSETGAALQAGWLGLFGTFLWLLNPCGRNRRTFGLVLAAWIGTLAALILLAASPSNQERFASLPPRPAWPVFVQLTIQSTRVFFSVIRKYHGFQVALAGIFFTLLSLRVHARQPRPLHVGRWIGALVMLVGAALGLVACCMAPSAYAQSSYPTERVLVTTWFVTALAVAALGWWLGRALAQMKGVPQIPWGWLNLLGGALALVLALTTWAAVPDILRDTPKFSRWAALWDGRDQQIRQASQQGLGEIEVMQLDHVIKDVGELSPDPDYWYNHCAEWYYQMSLIKANQPGWDQ
jgi:hypothetical protein